MFVLECFSLGRNMRQLFKTTSSEQQQQQPQIINNTDDIEHYDLRFLHSLKFLLICFVVFSHCMIFYPTSFYGPVQHFHGFNSFFANMRTGSFGPGLAGRTSFGLDTILMFR